MARHLLKAYRLCAGTNANGTTASQHERHPRLTGTNRRDPAAIAHSFDSTSVEPRAGAG
jgi:hypothetical protein